MRSLAILTIAFGVLAGCSDSDDMMAPDADFAQVEKPATDQVALARSYEVTLKNLTSGGQYFTPPLVAVHQGAADFFTAGKAASEGIRQIAENGNLGPMMDFLGMSKHVSSFTVAGSGEGPEVTLAPGEYVTVTLTADPGSNFISFASMLICTNDGFTGLDAAKLPKKIGDEITLYAGAYDAGTEINTEDFADIVPPCQLLGGVSSDDAGTGASDPALEEGGVVRHHDGVTGRDDLVPAIHGWTGDVAMIKVRRTG
ncbi:MAG: hypothetical protein HKO65_14120 [Gemmatimonadetes bacterium]|nr:spondin domain-containing protein [Gemmatimonadota bacterium]NNM06222.1 hypothetical protein [Gemmatimonadota bacterium]